MRQLESLNYLEDKNFPNSRYRHCFSAARKMYEYSRFKLNDSEDFSQEMFILGYLHDLGYAFDKDAFGHETVLYYCLKDYYDYVKAIRDHSFLIENSYKELNLLQYIDLTIDGMGNECTFNERLIDLTNRYGRNESVIITEEIMNYLILNGFESEFKINTNRCNLSENNFPINLFKNNYSVGVKMYAYSKNILKFNENYSRLMFILGNLYQINLIFKIATGKELSFNTLVNSFSCFENLINFYQNNFSSDISQLILFAKNTVDEFGNWVSFEEKLNSVNNSIEYNHIKEECEFLKDKGFNDLFGLN